jgi:hypothetical protein
MRNGNASGPRPEEIHLAFGFGVMRLEGGAELVRIGRLGHFRQRLIDLLFGVVDVLERVEEQVVEVFVGRGIRPDL